MKFSKSIVKKYNAYHKLDAITQLLNATTGSYYYDLKNYNIGNCNFS